MFVGLTLKTVLYEEANKLTTSCSHGVEMKKQKDIILAAEKLRREKWINEKTQQIKVSAWQIYVPFLW